MTTAVHAEWRPLPSTQQGYELQYDSNTSRVQTIVNGQARPMWDGVHRLENGQVLRIHNGIAVRDRTVMQTTPAPEVLREEVSACEMLSRSSCGLGGRCVNDESCRLANELLEFHKTARFSDRHKIERQCREALGEREFFPPCPVPPKGAFGGACADLVPKSCDTLGQCKQSESCNLARQLQQMEYDEQLMLLDNRRKTPTSRQCAVVFSDDAVFTPCVN